MPDPRHDPVTKRRVEAGILVAMIPWAIVAGFLVPPDLIGITIVDWRPGDTTAANVHGALTLVAVAVMAFSRRIGQALAAGLTIWCVVARLPDAALLLLPALVFSLAMRRRLWATVATSAVALASLVVWQATGLISVGVAGGAALALSSDLAHRAAVAEQTTALKQEALDSRNRIRTSIARELHDLVGHQLSLISLHLLGHRDVTDTTTLQDMLRRTETAARKGLDELRLLLDQLRPHETPTNLADLDQDTSLDEAIQRLTTTLTHHGFTVDLHTTGDLADVPPTLELTTRRILTEAATNILRHATPHTPVHAHLRWDDNGLTITITNQTPTDAPPPRSHGAGVRGLTERARLLNGHLTATPHDNHWTVSAHLPQPTTPNPPPPTPPPARPLRLLQFAKRRWGRLIGVMVALVVVGMHWDPAAPDRWQLLASDLITLVPVLLFLWRPSIGALAFLPVLAAAALGWLHVWAFQIPSFVIPSAVSARLSSRWFPLAVLVLMTLYGWVVGFEPGPTGWVLEGLTWPLVASIPGLVVRGLAQRQRRRQAVLDQERLASADIESTERDQLAHELHDIVTRHLTLISLQGMSYSGSDDPDTLHQALERVQASTDTALRDLRRLVTVLRDTHHTSPA